MALKQNVKEFNKDVSENEGYRYTTHAPYSSIVANKRISDKTVSLLENRFHTAIDVGCGDGAYTDEIKNRLPQLELSGFDPAPNAIEIAARKNPKVSFFVGNILDIDTFPKQKFEVAVIRGVLHHLSDPATAIFNSGFLSDYLLIIEPNGNNPILKIIEKASEYHRIHEEQSFSSATLSRWCVENGFKIEHLDYIGFVPFFFPTPLAKIIYFFQPFLEKIYFLKKFFGAQIVILCRKNKAS